MDLTATPEWKALAAHYDEISTRHLRELFADDPERTARMTAGAADLVLDYSKQRATDETLRLLVELARAAKVEEHRDAMFAGEHINTTEDRAVLHVALRMPPGIASCTSTARTSSATCRPCWARWGTSPTASATAPGPGPPASGSPLSSTSVSAARTWARPWPRWPWPTTPQPGLTSRFVSNVDPVDLYAATHDLDPETTLFVISSKTFTTLETLTNAAAARDWLLAGSGQCRRVTTQWQSTSWRCPPMPKAVAEFGIDTDNMLEFWDWVGGRYSYDSAIGFSLMVAIGRQAFGEMLAGFHAMDEHFRTTPLAENLPVIQGMLNVWYNNFFGAQTHAVLPYSHRLARFPAYLQQLTMESNGKSVKLDGTPVDGQTGEIFWGEPGTNGQHAFYQLIHQGTKLIPADFIAFAESTHDTGDQQDLLMANCLAQTKALAFGKTAEEIVAEGTPAAVVPHKVMPGNRPSSTILAPKVTPSVLGQLVALYEHTVFVEGTIWGIDSFDQWGVELGKVMAKELAPILTDTAAPGPLGPGLLDGLPGAAVPGPAGSRRLSERPAEPASGPASRSRAGAGAACSPRHALGSVRPSRPSSSRWASDSASRRLLPGRGELETDDPVVLRGRAPA